MAIHVRESFLDDSEDGRLDFFRHPGKNVGMKGERDLELAALRQAVNVPVERGAQTCFVEQRRMEQVRGLADFLKDFAHSLAELLVAAGGVEFHFYGGHMLGEIVVKFAGDAAALFVLDLEQGS